MRVDEPSPTLFLWAVDVGPWAAQPSVESAGGMEFLPRWTAEGCAPAATSTTWPLCGTSPDGYWCRFEKQGHHTSLSHPLSTTSLSRPMSASFSPSGSSMRCTKINRRSRHYTILELTGKIQELQNKINCMNDSRDFSRC